MPASWDRGNLEGLHPHLVAVILRARELSVQSFCLLSGKRTRRQQEAYVKAGTSQQLASPHLKGEAGDLVPLVEGKPSWDWELIYPIAEAMRTAARELSTTIRWGGFWGCLTDHDQPCQELVAEYVKLRKSQGKEAFIDGPHFELMLPREI